MYMLTLELFSLGFGGACAYIGHRFQGDGFVDKAFTAVMYTIAGVCVIAFFLLLWIHYGVFYGPKQEIQW